MVQAKESTSSITQSVEGLYYAFCLIFKFCGS